MNKVSLRYSVARKALESLERAIKNKKYMDKLATIAQSHEEAKNILNDSLIQRFEYCFDVTWKYLKEYLAAELKTPPTLKTPAEVFRTYLKIEFFSEQDMRTALNMLDHRNLTTHTYQQELADQIASVIPEYGVLMKKLLEKTHPK